MLRQNLLPSSHSNSLPQASDSRRSLTTGASPLTLWSNCRMQLRDLDLLTGGRAAATPVDNPEAGIMTRAKPLAFTPDWAYKQIDPPAL